MSIGDIEREVKLVVLRDLHEFIHFPPVGKDQELVFCTLMWMAKELELESCSAYYGNFQTFLKLNRHIPMVQAESILSI